MPSTDPRRPKPLAIVVGSSGGIGAALKRELADDGFDVIGLSRSRDAEPEEGELTLDLTSEGSIAAAADRLRDRGPCTRILIATGLLHDEEVAPEKALRDVNQASLTRLFAINAIGPALIAKHFIPLMPKHGRCVFAALSVRVGSISDNHLGGWYGYRASKAALNMLIRTLAIELSRTRPDAVCVALHPGTVNTGLSKPFQSNVAPDQLFTPEQSARHLLEVIRHLTFAQTGRHFAWDGSEVAP